MKRLDSFIKKVNDLVDEVSGLDDPHETWCDATMGPPGPFPCNCAGPKVQVMAKTLQEDL
jgi:hypothetical protein